MKTNNIFEDAIESCIWTNPYCAIYRYNMKLGKLYRHTFTRMLKTVYKDVSSDCDKKDDKDIPASGYDKCSYLTRYGLTNTRNKHSNNWQRKQI